VTRNIVCREQGEKMSEGNVLAKKSVDITHEWRKSQNFAEGDYITGLGQDMLVTEVEVGERIVRIFYVYNDEVRIKICAVGDDYIAKKRE
jgi:hypothetical protein